MPISHPGTILTQKPSPGRLIKTHQPIVVTTTKAPADTIAPALLQQSRESIEQTCHDMHLKFKSYELEYPAPVNSCIAQLPQAHDIIYDKKMILYFAKDKPNLYIMPDLTKQPLDQALETLKNYTDKISVFQGSQKIISPYPKTAKIIAQKPLAGSLVSIKPPLNIQLEISW